MKMVNELSLPVEERRVITDDGVSLAVQTAGSGPAVLMANGIGVRYPGLGPIVRHLATRHQVVLWDYRGIGGSRLNGEDVDLSMERHARDGLAIMEALNIGEAILMGWSMGVPVGLELLRRAPERIRAFAALFGAPGRPFEAGFPLPVARGIEIFFRGCRLLPKPAQALLDLGNAFPRLCFAVMSSIHFVGSDADRGIFAGDVDGIADVPKKPYFRTMVELARHDARDMLPRVSCPALVVAGTRDWLTPPSAAKEMAEAIPGAHLLVLDGATHFGLIEQVEPLLKAIDALIERASRR